MCNLRLNVSNEIPVVFHNGSNYDNKDYQKKNRRTIWISENTEKYKTFSVWEE